MGRRVFKLTVDVLHRDQELLEGGTDDMVKATIHLPNGPAHYVGRPADALASLYRLGMDVLDRDEADAPTPCARPVVVRFSSGQDLVA